MTTAQVVKTSVTVNNNSPIQDYLHPDDQTQPIFKSCYPREQGLKRYFWDPGFDQNTAGDSRKRKISWREMGFECFPGSRIHQNLCTAMRDLFPSLSGIWEIMATQIHLLAANAIYQGERSVASPIN